MLVAAKVRQRVGHHKGLDVAHKGVGGGGHAADVGIDAGYQKLVASALFQHLLQRRAVEGAVTPLHQHGVVLVRGQGGNHLLLLRLAGQSRPPHVVQQGTIFIALLFRLGGVVDRNVVLLAECAQSGDVRHHLGHHRAVFAPEVDEIVLHIMN